MPANILLVEDEPAIQELDCLQSDPGRPPRAARRLGGKRHDAGEKRPARPDPAGLDAAGHLGRGSLPSAARRRAHARRAHHHAHRPLDEQDKITGAGNRRRRLHHQAVLAARAASAHQGRAAPPRAADDRGRGGHRRPAPGPGHPPRARPTASRSTWGRPSSACCISS